MGLREKGEIGDKVFAMCNILIIDEEIALDQTYKLLCKDGEVLFTVKPADNDDIEYIFNLLKKTAEKRNLSLELRYEESFLARKALHYIKKNYEKKLTLTKVAEELYVSPYYLSKILNRDVGKSFADILNETRISEAKILLRNPALRVYDIAEKVGFSDMSHFSRVFKKIEGISANEYRNKKGEAYSLEYIWKVKKVLDF